MPLPTGNATFPGISVITAAQMTLSHGISPSSAIITTVPHTNFIAKVGDLKFTFGGETITFKDAIADQATFTQSGAGQRWTVRVFDRRWRWRFGGISGRYNERTTNGLLNADIGNRQAPQDLALLLLDAMGESNVDLSEIPNRERIFVNWDDANPAVELSAICEQLGCHIVLGIDDRVRIHRVGEGRSLPENRQQTNRSFSFNGKVRPSEIVVKGGPTLFQSKLLLEAVGEDTDGTIKPIAKLSYKPAGGWRTELPPYFSLVAPEHRQLARKSVYRWFRIKEQFDGSGFLPGSRDAHDSLFDEEGNLTIALLPSQITEDIPGVGLVQTPAALEGVFYPHEDAGGNTDPGTLYANSISIDPATGVVKTFDFMWALGADNLIDEPVLGITTSYTHRNFVTRRADAEEYTRHVAGPDFGAGAQILRRLDLFVTIKQVIDSVDNNGNIQRQHIDNTVKNFRDAAEVAATDSIRQYDEATTDDIQYAGLVRIQPDGAIQQVSWQVGNGPTVTRASRNMEFDRFVNGHDINQAKTRSIADSKKLEAIAAGNPAGNFFDDISHYRDNRGR